VAFRRPLRHYVIEIPRLSKLGVLHTWREFRPGDRPYEEERDFVVSGPWPTAEEAGRDMEGRMAVREVMES